MVKLDEKYNPLERLNHWDKPTKDMIAERIESEIGTLMEFNFFTEREGILLGKISDILVGQEKSGSYIKIAEILDKRLDYEKTGVRYGDDPWPGDFYKKGLSDFRKELESKNFTNESDLVSKKLKERETDFVSRFLKKVLSDSLEIFYSHPILWKEIGFPGPAFPEGYPFLSCSDKEDWEPVFK